jgi:hypothetical protein
MGAHIIMAKIMGKNRGGIVGLFNDPEQLKKAAEQVRDRKVAKFDAFTPFPVHGLEHAMGLKRSFLPWVTFAAGMTGGGLGLFFQIWTSASSWPLNVGGKPLVSLPAFIPVAFECTVLFAGLATAGALIAVCGLPNLFPTILDPRLTSDKFALFVSSEDAAYNEKEFGDIMRKAGAYEVRVV